MPILRGRRRIRRIILPLTVAVVLWLVSVTAACRSIGGALRTLAREGEVAMEILRFQLGDSRAEDELPLAVRIVLSQSPLLYAGREAVEEMRKQREAERAENVPGDVPETAPEGESQKSPSSHAVFTEVAQSSDAPLVIVENGVSARTLVPASDKGYIVTGGVYVDNRSDKIFDETLFDEPFDARLTGSGEPEVLIVHTHGSEAYTMPPGREYVPSGDCRTTDETVSVVRVGEEIAYTLRNAGISVLHITTLHDYPEYSGAYDRSLRTVEDCLKRYPSISLVLDVHRDAVTDGEGNHYKVVSGETGMNAAQMAFVIGTDGGGLSHPRWQENLKLAAAIQKELCSVCPTLMRPITVRNSRYNQHTTTGSLLVEMGAAGNSLEEALLSARLLGNAVADTVLTAENPELPAKE